MKVIQSNQSIITIDNLSPCLSYWVVVTSVDCINRVSSSPKLLGLFELVQFKFSMSFGDSVSCKTWIIEDYARKLSDVQISVSAALEHSSCGMPIPCFANSHFTCGNDPKASLINYQ